MNSSYKSEKEAFVSDTIGSTITQVNLLCSVALASLILHYVLQTRRTQNLFTEWIVLILPLLLSMTLFATHAILLSSILLLIAGAIHILIPPRRSWTSESSLPSSMSISPSSRSFSSQPPSRPHSPSHSIHIAPSPPESESESHNHTDVRSSKSYIPPSPALTIYRSHMLLMTVIAIIAVDFPVFPRALAKCESFGVSMMDLGVGSFVFSQGIVCALPLLKDRSYLCQPTFPKLLSSARRMAPVFILGLVRVLLVKGTEYPEHASEYGTHWNFFFTLAVLPPLQILLHPVILYAPISFIGVAIGVAHQILLSSTSLQNYTLNAPRMSLISHNKEGIVSLVGYLSIHLLGLSLGTVILPSSPSDFRRAQRTLHIASPQPQRQSSSIGTPPQITISAPSTNSRHKRSASVKFPPGRQRGSGGRQDDKTATELCAYAVLWWTFLGVSVWCVRGTGDVSAVSRRLANLPYILWIAAFNSSFILCYLLLDMAFFSNTNGSTSIASHSMRPGPPLNSLNVPQDSKYTQDDDIETTGEHVQQTPLIRSDLLDAINRAGLPVFLLANVLTGLVNLSMQTMYASDFVAMIVLSVYSYALCVTAVWWTKGGAKKML